MLYESNKWTTDNVTQVEKSHQYQHAYMQGIQGNFIPSFMFWLLTNHRDSLLDLVLLVLATGLDFKVSAVLFSSMGKYHKEEC